MTIFFYGWIVLSIIVSYTFSLSFICQMVRLLQVWLLWTVLKQWASHFKVSFLSAIFHLSRLRLITSLSIIRFRPNLISTSWKEHLQAVCNQLCWDQGWSITHTTCKCGVPGMSFLGLQAWMKLVQNQRRITKYSHSWGSLHERLDETLNVSLTGKGLLYAECEKERVGGNKPGICLFLWFWF